MRNTGSLNPTDQTRLMPDAVASIIISTAGAVVAQDWPSAADIAEFNSQMLFVLNARSTGAALPSTNEPGTNTGSSVWNEICPQGHDMRRLIGDSTGYSITAPTSGVVTISFWHI